MSITEFILARVAEKERAATTITSCDEAHPLDSMALPPGLSVSCLVMHYRVDRLAQADCKAVRTIVEWHDNYSEDGDEECCEERWGPLEFQAPEDREVSAGVTSSGGLSMRESFATQKFLGCVTLMMLAAIWSDHEDYRAEWQV